MNNDYLQSLVWQKISQANGEKTLTVEDEAFFCFLIKKKIKYFSNYYYCPRGPIFQGKENLNVWQKLLSLLVDEAKKNNSLFIKLDPGLINIELFKQAVKSLSLKIKKTKSTQPQSTLYLNLNLSEPELLKQMKPKTRYNIRVALKHKLQVVEDQNDFEEFFKLLSATKDRDSFRLHPKSHYLNLVNNGIKIISVKEGKTILATGLFSFYKETVTYLHGASNYQYRSKMAPYLLHFEVIKKAKEMNFKYYDFYGIDEKKWPGVTRFKKGFGGQILNYPDSYNLIIKPINYSLYQILRNLKNVWR